MEANASAAGIRFEHNLLRGLDYTIASWEGKEGFSQIAEHLVAIRCWSGSLRPVVARLQPATIELDCRCGPDHIIPRSIRGIVRKVASDRDDRDRPVYTFHVVPRLWLLSQRETTRIFYRQSAQEIIRTVLDAYGIPFQIATTRPPRLIAHCAQGRETDLNFIMRLAEDHDIYFFFRPDADIAVFADDPTALDAAFPHPEFTWQLPGDAERVPVETVFEVDGAQPRWLNATADAARPRCADHAGTHALKTANRNSIPQLPPDLLAESENDHRANRPLAHHIVTIRSSIRSAAVGVIFTLTGFPNPDSTTEYQIIRADHFFEDNQYHNRLRCLPRTIPYHPEPMTRRPSGFDHGRIGNGRVQRLLPDCRPLVELRPFPPRTAGQKENVRSPDK